MHSALPLAPPPPERGRSPSEARRVGVTRKKKPPPGAQGRPDLPLSGGGRARGAAGSKDAGRKGMRDEDTKAAAKPRRLRRRYHGKRER